MWPSRYTSWIIEVKPNTSLLPNKSQDFSLICVSSFLPLSPLYWWAGSLISSPGSRSDHRFSEGNVIWLLLFLKIILRNHDHCHPDAAGALVFEDRKSSKVVSWSSVSDAGIISIKLVSDRWRPACCAGVWKHCLSITSEPVFKGFTVSVSNEKVCVSNQ